jgi:uncharacterized protein with PQ loop repeat
MLYGYISNDVFPLLVTYAVGDFLSIGYLSVYYKWSKDPKYVLKLCGFTFIINVVVTIYAIVGQSLQPLADVEQAIGVIAIGSSIILYGSPLAAIKQVLQTKSAASIPFGMVVVGTVNNVLWILYGFLIDDLVLIIPTVINGTFGVIQLVLYAAYRPHREPKDFSSAGVAAVSAVVPQATSKLEAPGTLLTGSLISALQAASTSASSSFDKHVVDMEQEQQQQGPSNDVKFLELRSPTAMMQEEPIVNVVIVDRK